MSAVPIVSSWLVAVIHEIIHLFAIKSDFELTKVCNVASNREHVSRQKNDDETLRLVILQEFLEMYA